MDESADQLDTAIREVAALIGNAPAEAEHRLEGLLATAPDHPNIRLLLAAARRYRGRPSEARSQLESLLVTHPDFALAHQELGLTLNDLDEPEAAEEALTRAVDLAPDLHPAWKVLADLRARSGDTQGSELAQQNHAIAVAGTPELFEAGRLLITGKLGQAEKICRAYLMDHPADPSAIRMLAEIGLKLGRLEDAEKLLDRCLQLAPDFHLARSNYANLLSRRLEFRRALIEIDRVIAAEPDHPGHRLLKASILVRVGDHEAAIDLYRQVLASHPVQPRTYMSLGHALKTLGRQQEAIVAYRKSIEQHPGLGEAYWSLANLKTFRFEDHELDSMTAQSGRQHKQPDDYFNLFFALGKAHEDRGDYDQAFANYQRGNTIRRRTIQWDADEHHRSTRNLIGFFDAEFFEDRQNWGCPDDSPIFIVGLPRAGSTLLEQILASHSQVEGTMELPDILSMARRLSGKKRSNDASQYPGVLADLSKRDVAALGQEYLDRTAIHRNGAPRFIDKMPNNFMHTGFIHLILPHARIIDARRHPIGCCFSGFKQLFASGQNFTYDLAEIGRYYRDYVSLMAHWDRILPGLVLRMQYESVVDGLSTQVERLLEHCGLPFEAACLDFHRTERAVRTASSEQVRQPLFSEGVDQWRHFESHLGELRTALGPELGHRDGLADGLKSPSLRTEQE